ncbi:pyridine nucleotide-disulfide oxidoreductase [Halioglobus maricola]|uniref:Pyridine nucleotide-disulfide oxidoreductase n=1 Tax=Halioglobus maricola TaxID=2601894 RepID=A0A5P9NPQ7_9GAMM|nr:NAD(P)-binding domain-containing protein [Halioglobus maricola]QFU77264.1 pyridine nucleotide-disulfide oxidoreductase [Halioglobus maricola]
MNAKLYTTPPRLTTVVVVGAGQAGLSCSHYLSRFGIDHVVLERGEVANSWRTERWDSLRLLTPNWQSQLPGMGYSGDNPDGYMHMGEVVDFISGYARQSEAPVQVQTRVTGVEPVGSGYRVKTNCGDWHCMSIIVASGAFSTPTIPRFSEGMGAQVEQLDTHRYRNPDRLAPGGVLVVGAAASGAQIAREISRSGRKVLLATGEHVRMPRRYRGKDIQYWMDATGLLDEDWEQVDDVRRVRRLPSAQLMGSDDFADLDLNSLQAEGVEVVGRLAGARDGRLQFSGGLANVVRLADLKLNRMLDRIDQYIESSPDGAGAQGPATRTEPTQLASNQRLEMELASEGISTVIWATGYRPDYSWLDLPVMDARGMPRHNGGVTELPGVYLMGLPFMRRRRSSFMSGAGEDALDICHHLLAYLGRPVEWYWQKKTA